ncbi:hypothetical protein BCR37DRAFT_377696 [Protomyces lactucae-debilis]|uniref:Uncharacterized protein n=1 Tax=Protomyces lactucae-debilis TaxID=2754530 RepID=A0A1Y2FLP8_PROLT|nr:uncharacterized protein BCR37DRAFT_377696 [Protomyces lactucae-debilis]ORY84859.1 hypothetical protein BCR37DRAFT_377696 [Protomyces lactucae-debilis]
MPSLPRGFSLLSSLKIKLAGLVPRVSWDEQSNFIGNVMSCTLSKHRRSGQSSLYLQSTTRHQSKHQSCHYLLCPAWFCFVACQLRRAAHFQSGGSVREQRGLQLANHRPSVSFAETITALAVAGTTTASISTRFKVVVRPRPNKALRHGPHYRIHIERHCRLSLQIYAGS